MRNVQSMYYKNKTGLIVKHWKDSYKILNNEFLWALHDGRCLVLRHSPLSEISWMERKIHDAWA